MTDEHPGDIFSLSESDQVLMEVDINDVPDIRTVEEECMADGQQGEAEADGAGAMALDGNHEEAIALEGSDNIAIPP